MNDKGRDRIIKKEYGSILETYAESMRGKEDKEYARDCLKEILVKDREHQKKELLKRLPSMEEIKNCILKLHDIRFHHRALTRSEEAKAIYDLMMKKLEEKNDRD